MLEKRAVYDVFDNNGTELAVATQVGKELLPPHEASLIASLIERDAPFYAAHISSQAVDGLMKLAMRQKLVSAPVAYDDLVAVQFRHLWGTDR